MTRPTIVTFEGIDGSGKSTLVARLRNHYADTLAVWTTQEPYQQRQFSTDPFIATLELVADRRKHCRDIADNPQAADLILIDRFDLSTVAYQGFGGDVPIGLINQLNDLATERVHVTRRILLDVSVDVAIDRILSRGGEVVTNDDVAKLERVNSGYRRLASLGRLIRIDATQSPDDVLRNAIRLIDEVLSQ